jgi:hypothetical protein
MYISFALRDNFKKCLDELEKNEIIKKVKECSQWVNFYVLVKKEDGSLRICLDPQHFGRYRFLRMPFGVTVK